MLGPLSDSLDDLITCCRRHWAPCAGWRCCLRSGCCPLAARTTSGRWATRGPAAPAPVRQLHCHRQQDRHRRAWSWTALPLGTTCLRLDNNCEHSLTKLKRCQLRHVISPHFGARQSCTTTASAAATLLRWSTRTTPMCWRSGTSCSSRCLQNTWQLDSDLAAD